MCLALMLLNIKGFLVHSVFICRLRKRGVKFYHRKIKSFKEVSEGFQCIVLASSLYIHRTLY